MKQQLVIAFWVVVVASLLSGCAEKIEEVVASSEEPQEDFAKLEMDITLDDLLAKHVEARGGSEALNQFTSVRLEGKFSSLQEGSYIVENADVVVTLAPGRFHRVIEGTGHTDSVDVDSAWRVSPGGGVPEPAPMSDEDAARYRRSADLAGPLVDAAAKGHTLELTDKIQGEWKAFYRVNVEYAGGGSGLYFIDAENFLVARVRERRMAGGYNVTQVTSYRDYSPEAGVEFPHLEEVEFLEADFRQESKWQVVTVHPEISPDLFVRPAS